MAHVVNPNTQIINTCPDFYAADMLPVGHPDYVSAVGTFLHEVSHMSDANWAGTLDKTFSFPGGVYYYAQAQSLPKSEAVKVATNYEFYFVNYDSE